LWQDGGGQGAAVSGAQSTEELQELLASIGELAGHISGLDRPAGLPPPGARLPPPEDPAAAPEGPDAGKGAEGAAAAATAAAHDSSLQRAASHEASQVRGLHAFTGSAFQEGLIELQRG
jgi:hypothetical protein